MQQHLLARHTCSPAIPCSPVVVCEGEVGGGGAAKVGRDVLGEPVVEEEHLGADEKDGWWDGVGVVVVAKVEEGEVDEPEHAGGEATIEAVVFEVELVEEEKVGKDGNSAVEAIGVGMEERKVGKLVDEVVDGRGGEGKADEVDGGNGAHVVKPRWGLTLEALGAVVIIVADAEPHPRAGLVVGVAGDGLLKALDDEVRLVLQDVLEVARLQLPSRRRALVLTCRRCSVATDANADANCKGFSITATAVAEGGNDQYREED
ncbi:hypothetical protein B296_00008777 [Ensete ventricosum]|uniref:Uncharacterized protein n=1 Tax=Ensete ventricosum TaxID=4639 RepID=A0A427AT16_ENSVE|nr:hypothetical protein B296_00008777 [Ensete ventricosum]